ncbi:MHYT domain-containing protein [Palleronia abyssalis]
MYLRPQAPSGILRAMVFLDYGHNLWLAAIAFVVALVAGATGLTLTKDLSEKSLLQRKLAVALAAITMGGGIWSMHFVAMLGLQMPVLFYYDAAVTLVSALIAILLVTLALILLHFTRRTKATIVGAGALVGVGVLAMHYVGMAGMQLCQPIYTPFGVISAAVVAIGLCIMAFGVAYGSPSSRNIVIGTACFGVAVTSVHFVAMAGTNFVALSGTREIGLLISNEAMAIGVILSSFAIFGTFLWVGSTLLMPAGPEAAVPSRVLEPQATDQPEEVEAPLTWLPCERDGGKVRVPSRDIAFVRADGHYTQVYTMSGRYFCVWPITEAAKRLGPDGFIRVHRSYLVNPSKVSLFERGKDKGRCSFGAPGLPQVPVSRSHLKDALTAFS